MAANDKNKKKQPEQKIVRVRAVRRGFYGHMLREPGKVFQIKLAPDEKFPSWCEEVDETGKAIDDDSPAGDDKLAPSGEQKGSSSDDVI